MGAILPPSTILKWNAPSNRFWDFGVKLRHLNQSKISLASIDINHHLRSSHSIWCALDPCACISLCTSFLTIFRLFFCCCCSFFCWNYPRKKTGYIFAAVSLCCASHMCLEKYYQKLQRFALSLSMLITNNICIHLEHARLLPLIHFSYPRRPPRLASLRLA